MSETKSHKEAKKKAAGEIGKTEVKIPGGKRVDAMTKRKATEIERSGTDDGLLRAAKRLRDSGREQKVLQVPQNDMSKAVEAMKKAGVAGTVKNMSETKKHSVRRKSK